MAITMNKPIVLKPTGPYTIGLTKFDLFDEKRPEIQYPKGRLIPIQIYFPMEMGEHMPQPKVFEDRAPKTFFSLETQVYSSLTNLNEFDSAQINSGQFPIILLNHGHDVSMTDYACIAEDLASHGYVVISIQHQLETDIHPPAFWIERSIPKYALVIDNMLYVFEWLKENNDTLFKGCLCLTKVGLIGHSIGGQCFASFCSTISFFLQEKATYNIVAT